MQILRLNGSTIKQSFSSRLHLMLKIDDSQIRDTIKLGQRKQYSEKFHPFITTWSTPSLRAGWSRGIRIHSFCIADTFAYHRLAFKHCSSYKLAVTFTKLKQLKVTPIKN